MNKLIILGVLAMILAGCSDSDSEQKYKHLLRQYDTINDSLRTCEAQLSMYRDSGSSDTESSTESTEQSSEPSCYEVNYDELYVDGKLIATCASDNVKVRECGISAESCESGYNYYCLQNVKLKTISKKECN